MLYWNAYFMLRSAGSPPEDAEEGPPEGAEQSPPEVAEKDEDSVAQVQSDSEGVFVQ